MTDQDMVQYVRGTCKSVLYPTIPVIDMQKLAMYLVSHMENRGRIIGASMSSSIDVIVPINDCIMISLWHDHKHAMWMFYTNGTERFVTV
jgi:hypothetical protein